MLFEENASRVKRRPVIIAKDAAVYVLTLCVTSHGVWDTDHYDYQLQFWREAGLNLASVVRVSKLAQFKLEAVHERIGRLHPMDVVEIQKLMYKLYRTRNVSKKE